MHKIITYLFSSILTLVHLVFFIGLGLVIFGEIGEFPSYEVSSTQWFMINIGVAVGYILFAGITSVLIRINQNLETISSRLRDWPRHEEILDETNN